MVDSAGCIGSYVLPGRRRRISRRSLSQANQLGFLPADFTSIHFSSASGVILLSKRVCLKLLTPSTFVMGEIIQSTVGDEMQNGPDQGCVRMRDCPSLILQPSTRYIGVVPDFADKMQSKMDDYLVVHIIRHNARFPWIRIFQGRRIASDSIRPPGPTLFEPPEKYWWPAWLTHSQQ